MPIKVTVTVKGWEAARVYLSAVEKRLRKPDLSRPVQAVARYWRNSYRTEGGAVGGWAALAQRTIEDRAYQGYRAGPILVRNGGLRELSTDFFARRKRGGSLSRTTPYDPRNITTTAKLVFDPNRAILSIRGPQVYNQWPGHKTPRPARPFWFTTPPVHSEARKSVIEWIVVDVLEKK